MSMTPKLILDKVTPHLIWLPNRSQISLCLNTRNVLMQDSVKKHECRNTLVGGTMNQHSPAFESVHHPAKRLEILCGGRFEIHRDMNIRHAKAGNNAPLMRKRVVRCRKREIDDRLKTGLADQPKLTFGRLTSGAESLTDRAEAINLGERCR